MRLAHLVAAGAPSPRSQRPEGAWPPASRRGRSERCRSATRRRRRAPRGRRLLSRDALRDSQEPVSVSYRTQNETAHAGEDYESTEGTLHSLRAETAKSVEVLIRGDRKVEPDEFFSVFLFAPVGATIAEPGGVGHGDDPERRLLRAAPQRSALQACEAPSRGLQRARRDTAHGRREGDDDVRDRRRRGLRGVREVRLIVRR